MISLADMIEFLKNVDAAVPPTENNHALGGIFQSSAPEEALDSGVVAFDSLAIVNDPAAEITDSVNVVAHSVEVVTDSTNTVTESVTAVTNHVSSDVNPCVEKMEASVKNETMNILKELKEIKNKHFRTSSKVQSDTTGTESYELKNDVIPSTSSSFVVPVKSEKQIAFQETPFALSHEKHDNVRQEPSVAPSYGQFAPSLHIEEAAAASVSQNHYIAGSGDNKNVENHQCSKCNKTFSYLARFQAHQVKDTCDVKEIKCYQCNKILSNSKSLIRHIKLVHEKPVFQCSHCLKLFETQKRVDKHLKNYHVHNLCGFCGKKYNNVNTLRSHKYQCKAKKDSADGSRVKSRETKDKQNIGQHHDVDGSKEPVTSVARKYERACVVCNKVYTSRGGYNKHMKKHTIIKQQNVSLSAHELDAVEEVFDEEI